MAVPGLLVPGRCEGDDVNACRFCGREGRFYDPPLRYLQWHEWADRKSKTHEQHPCPDCGRYTIWRVRVAAKETTT